MKAGAFDFLEKPVSSNPLLEVAEGARRRRAPAVNGSKRTKGWSCAAPLPGGRDTTTAWY